MIRNGDRPSQRGLPRDLDSNPRPEPRGAAAGPGRPTLKESHRRPIASILHPKYSQDKPVPTKVEKRQVCTTGFPWGFPARGVVSCRILQSPGKSPNTSLLPEEKHARSRTNQWSSDSPMDLELPRIQHRLECIRNPVAVKCVSRSLCQ